MKAMFVHYLNKVRIFSCINTVAMKFSGRVTFTKHILQRKLQNEYCIPNFTII